jgi:hypothetical protein
VISDPINHRRLDKLEPQQRRSVRAARRSVKSKSGKDLLRRRGMHIERSFAHILDAGGMRRTTLRGWENLNKRFKLAAAFYNLSQLMRFLFGFGTPKQLAAAMERGGRTLLGRWAAILILIAAVVHRLTLVCRCTRRESGEIFWNHRKIGSFENAISSTGC